MTNPEIRLLPKFYCRMQRKRIGKPCRLKLIAQMAQRRCGDAEDLMIQRFSFCATRESFRIYGANHHLLQFEKAFFFCFPRATL